MSSFGNFFTNTLRLRNIANNIQINGPFYFYRNYFGQELTFLSLRGGIIGYTWGYNGDGVNYLANSLQKNGSMSINEKYKASNQKIIDGYWPEKYKPKNTFSKQRNIGNIVNLETPSIVNVRDKNYDFDELQNELRNNIFASPTTEDGTQVREIYTFPDVLEIENTFYQKYNKNDFIRALTFEQFSNKVYKDRPLIYNSHDGLTSYSFYNEDYQENQNTFPLTGNPITLHDDNPVNLIERTQRLFQNNKVKTLINRFNSVLDEKDLNDLDSGYDKTYGYSRGRNLKNSDNKAVEFEGGYKSPYCRTWTAFHQYDRLSRLIRPFYNGTTVQTIDQTQKEYGTLRPNNGEIRLTNNTVLDTLGFVRITPTGNSKDKNHDIKKCMFSIENLAWRDIKLDDAKISKEQQGPNGGRIMWFPPYNLKFTENVNVEWNSNKFIGRGEQIYTYTNTDRQGTLNFTLLIDHPSILNKYVGNQKNVAAKNLEEDILRYFAGCGDLNGENSNNDKNKERDTEYNNQNLNPKLQQKTQQIAIIAFFPNNWTGRDYKDKSEAIDKLKEYEYDDDTEKTFDEIDKEGAFSSSEKNYNSGLKLNHFTTGDDTYNTIMKEYFADKINDNNFKLYSIFDENYGIEKLADNITNSSFFGNSSNFFKLGRTKINGFASSHGDNYEINEHIASRRGRLLGTYSHISCDILKNIGYSIYPEVKNVSDDEKKVITALESFMVFDDDDVTLAHKKNGGVFEEIRDVTNLVDLTSEEQINKLEAKLARCAYIVFNIEWNPQTVPSNTNIEPGNFTVNEDMSESTSGNSLNNQNEYSSTVVEEKNEDYTYDNEYMYFQQIASEGKMQYEYIANKVKYFNPAFHSITPEGFNARLTFLHQCTRQGPTNDLSSGRVDENSNSYLKYAGNLAFGRPPYCILRIGDFYHTKICITALSIDYDNGGGIQWDLNQEGIGVQPMMANITMNFTFIGGQDLTGPIERLQNAITANYYANASVYDDKADIRDNNGIMTKVYDPTIKDKN